MDTFQRASSGDVSAQRELRNVALDYHHAGLQQALDDALNWARMLAAKGDCDDVALYETILLRRLLRAQFMQDEQRRALLMAEALAFLDRRIDAGDLNAVQRLGSMTGSASPEEMALARAWVGGTSGEPRHDETGGSGHGA